MSHFDRGETCDAQVSTERSSSKGSEFNTHKVMAECEQHHAERPMWLSRDAVAGQEAITGKILDHLSTGDVIVKEGQTTALQMPSGESLLVGKNCWSLRDKAGKEIANNSSGTDDKLADGASVDIIIPFIGPPWTVIGFENGDSITINQGKLNVQRDGKTAETPTRFHMP